MIYIRFIRYGTLFSSYSNYSTLWDNILLMIKYFLDQVDRSESGQGIRNRGPQITGRGTLNMTGTVGMRMQGWG